MSPIFNHAALQRLSTDALNALKRSVIETLADPRLGMADRASLRASLASIALVLRARFGPGPSKPCP